MSLMITYPMSAEAFSLKWFKGKKQKPEIQEVQNTPVDEKSEEKDILVIMRDKRDYVLSSLDVDNKYVKETVYYCDKTIDYINLIYNNIIFNKKVHNVNVIKLLNNILEHTKALQEVLDEQRTTRT